MAAGRKPRTADERTGRVSTGDALLSLALPAAVIALGAAVAATTAAGGFDGLVALCRTVLP